MTPRNENRDGRIAVEGTYRYRLVRKGPWMAAELRWENERLAAYIDGNRSVGDADSWGLDAVMRIALWGEPIDRAEHDFLIAKAKHAREHDPSHPMARPTKPINLRLVDPASIYRGKT